MEKQGWDVIRIVSVDVPQVRGEPETKGQTDGLTMERTLIIFLRSVGFVAALAAFGVVMPYAWMNDIHQYLGLGVLPDAPIVGYLARSTSAFYALYGGLLLVLSFDLSRYRGLLCCVGVGTLLLGAALTGVDRVEGLPFFWQVGEGPFDMAAGTILLLLARSVKADPES